MSDDGAHGITVIAFIGSVFSPYYAWARRRARGGGSGDSDTRDMRDMSGGGDGGGSDSRSVYTRGADPLDHCAVNVALYDLGDRSSRQGSRWAMTERGRRHIERDACSLRIGPSALQWVGDTLHIELDEIAVPWLARVRGCVRVHAPQRFSHEVALAKGHRWCPIAPAARVEVDLGAVRWSGPGYLDANVGEAPLESAFRRWDWSRARLSGGDSVVFYDVDRIAAEPLRLGLRFGANGRVDAVEPPPRAALPCTAWRLARGARNDIGAPIRVASTLTDAPFYARSLLDAQWLGERLAVMHESLSLARFDTAWVRAMLPFRMPRVAG